MFIKELVRKVRGRKESDKDSYGFFQGMIEI